MTTDEKLITAGPGPLCEKCTVIMRRIVERRIRKILEYHPEDGTEFDEEGTGQAIAFHMMEILYILDGQQTCGVFDDYGAPAHDAPANGERPC